MDIDRRKLAAGMVLAAVAFLMPNLDALGQSGTFETNTLQTQTVAPRQPASLLEQGIQLEQQGQWAER